MSSFAGSDLTDITQVRSVLVQLLADPSVYPTEFKSWVPNWLGVNPPDLNIDQLQGFDNLVATQDSQSAAVAALSASLTSYINSQVNTNKAYSNSIGGNTPQGTNSTSYTNLATVGPTITVPAGSYAVVWGAGAFISNTANGARMAISVNGAAPNDALGCATSSDVRAGITFGTSITVAGASNTIQAKYKSSSASATANFADRWIIAMASQ